MSDWKQILSGIAPTIATALGGPMAGAATKFIAGSLLGDENASEKQIEEFVLGANPEQLAVIKQIDNDFEVKMKELNVDLQRIAVDNTKSARDMATKTTLTPQMVLSVLFVGGYFVILFLLMSGHITIETAIKDTVLLLLGLLTREVPTIMQFWFGSSFGSKKKADKIENKIL